MKYKEIKNLSEEEREKKLKDLKVELVKSKTGTTNPRKIKKAIARIHTFNSSKGGIGKK